MEPVRRLLFCVACLLAAQITLPREAHSQPRDAASPVVVGTRVRVWAPGAVSGRVEGTVLEVDERSFQILADDQRLAVPRQAIERLEVSTGRRRRTLKGMLIGAGIGAVAMPPALYDSCLGDCGNRWDVESILAGVAVGAAWGAGIGALIKKDRWSPVPLERVRVSLSPLTARGFQAWLSLSF